jgi:prophage regulatory protein
MTSTTHFKEIMPSADITPITATLLSKKSLSARLGISTRTIENMVLAKKFPPGVRIGKFVFWKESVVEKWQTRVFGVQQGWQP